MSTTPYASVADAELIYGAAAIAVVCDRDLDGAVDTSSFELHLLMATQTMNAYLLGRIALPLATPPEHFKKLCVDIARYTATPNADTATLEIRKRYEEALHHMELIAKGVIKLEAATDTPADNASVTPQHRTACTQSLDRGARTFTAHNLKCIL